MLAGPDSVTIPVASNETVRYLPKELTRVTAGPNAGAEFQVVPVSLQVSAATPRRSTFDPDVDEYSFSVALTIVSPAGKPTLNRR
jgi:hypothetical protein